MLPFFGILQKSYFLFKPGVGGRDFKCCCVQENIEKLTLSDPFRPLFAMVLTPLNNPYVIKFEI